MGACGLVVDAHLSAEVVRDEGGQGGEGERGVVDAQPEAAVVAVHRAGWGEECDLHGASRRR